MAEYEVEAIEQKRVVNGITMYYLKWSGFPSTLNSWEPMENLNCQALIDEFENCEKAALKYGFGLGMEPSKILSAYDISGERWFVMSWENSDELNLVPAKVANSKCPQLVLQFYTEHFKWDILDVTIKIE